MNMIAMPCVTTTPAIRKPVEPICQLLRVAQHRLVDETLPQSLKMVAYVRLCCAAIRKSQTMGLDTHLPLNPKTPYLSLLSLLTAYNHEWWNTCSVSPQGHLVCQDSIVRDLLEPLNVFVAQHLAQ